MKKMIFGFAGLPASGKGTVADYMRSTYDAGTYRYSSILTAEAEARKLPLTRDTLIRLSEELRAEHGEDFLAKKIAEKANSDEHGLVIVEGIRRMADIEHLAQLPNFVLVEIFADMKTRYERAVLRRERPDDATKTFEEFVAEHQRSTELSIPEVVSHATEHIDNNGTLEQLHSELDALVNRYKIETEIHRDVR